MSAQNPNMRWCPGALKYGLPLMHHFLGFPFCYASWMKELVHSVRVMVRVGQARNQLFFCMHLWVVFTSLLPPFIFFLKTPQCGAIPTWDGGRGSPIPQPHNCISTSSSFRLPADAAR